MPLIKFILIYALFFGLSWLAHEHFKDYCFEQHRKLADKEYLTIAFNYLRDRKVEHMKVHDWDNTLDTYLLHHPGCCRVSKEYGLLSPFTTEVTAEITYERTDEAKTRVNGLEYTHYYSITIMTDCGRPYDHFGESITAPTTGFNQQKI